MKGLDFISAFVLLVETKARRLQLSQAILIAYYALEAFQKTPTHIRKSELDKQKPPATIQPA